MQYFILAVVSFLASLLTFYSGFGLGTILLPVFALWLPIEISVGLTGIVHLLNNLFKFFLVYKFIDKGVLIRFGLPAILAAFLGAMLLIFSADIPSIYDYMLFDKKFEILPIKLIIAILIIFFTLFEILPKLKNLKIDPKYLSYGGALSGFFGGLSGHQGALRSAFLIRCGLSKESFIATGTAIACLIDIARLGIYSKNYSFSYIKDNYWMILTATIFAFIGAYWGNKSLKKVTMESIQNIVSFFLLLIALAMAAGLI